MTTTLSNNYDLTIPVVGSESGTWGTVLNNGIFTPIDNILGTQLVATVTVADVTLTNSQFQNAIFNIKGALTGNRNLILPLSPNSATAAVGGKFIILNNTSGNFSLTVKTVASGSTGVTVPQGQGASLYSDSVNVGYDNTGLPASIQGVNGNPNGQLAGTAGSAITNASVAADYANGAFYLCTTSGTATSATWANVAGFAGFNMPTNLSLSASVNSNLLTVNILAANTATTPSAGNAVIIPFRDVTLTAGDPASVSITSALSISTFATGATFGASNSTAFRLWVALFNNGGTAVAALINCSNTTQIFPLNESTLQSTTAMSGSATSAGVFYTPNGTTLTNKAFRIVGYVDYASGLVTAGTYNTAPTTVQLFGPGLKKPGEIMQTVYVGTATSTTSITPTSAVNKVRVAANGFFLANTNGVTILLSRGTTTLDTRSIFAQSVGGILELGYSFALLDAPNSASQQSYFVSSASSSLSANSIIVDEVVG